MKTTNLFRKKRRNCLSRRDNFTVYHRKPAWPTLGNVCFTAAGILVVCNAAKADGIEVLAGGALKFGVSAAEDERLSDGEGDRGYTFFADSELHLEANVSPTDQLKIGAKVVLDVDADLVSEANADQTFVFFSGGFGIAELGRTEGAEDTMALGADTIAAGTGGIDGDTANLGRTQIINSGDAAKISYFTPRIASLQAGLSYTPDTGDGEGASTGAVAEDDDEEALQDHIGVGVNTVRTFGDASVGLAAVGSFGNSRIAGNDDLSSISVGSTLTIDDVEIGTSYGWNKGTDVFDFATFGITVSLGEANVGAGYNYVDEKIGGTTHVVVLSGDIAVLKGIELQGDVSYADADNEPTDIATVLALELAF